ncbi:ATP-grasp domain-containing protein [Mesorhizobium sp. B2-6-2]|nr:ATP-grasp domain-containing protein [Mesorhizobium sp. B2-6-2]
MWPACRSCRTISRLRLPASTRRDWLRPAASALLCVSLPAPTTRLAGLCNTWRQPAYAEMSASRTAERPGSLNMSDAAVIEYRSDRFISAGETRPAALPLELLRDGTAADTVFFFPGLGGHARELARLAERLAMPGRIFGLSYSFQTGSSNALGRLAASAVAALRTVQPHGPYRLVGYSFGALVAVEVARQLKHAGEKVAPPILIDAYYDQRFWPGKAWWFGQVRRTKAQLVQIGWRLPGPAFRELTFRARRLAQRLQSRWRSSAPPVDEPTPETLADANMAALRAYDPPFYPGALILLSAGDPTMFGCRPADLWRARSYGLVVEEVAGDHLDLVRATTSIERLAGLVDKHLGPEGTAHRPLALVVTTFRWPMTVGVVAALARGGFRVVALCPRRHPMRRQPGLASYRMPWQHPERALRTLIARVNPDLVVPCDEPALDLVRNIRDSCRSAWPDLSRSEMIEIALAAGVKAPPTQRIGDPAELDKWINAYGLPIVLKTDRSWGGRGVAIARDRAHAAHLWRCLSRRPSLFRALKRAIVNADLSSLRDLWRGRKPFVHAQAYVAGRDANVALAVVDGKVLAAVAVEVLESRCRNGPAKTVRVIDHPGILQAASKVMEQLRLTGLAGIDFILDEEGTAHLIEVNGRATPTCRLALGRDRDPVGALRANFSGAAAAASLQGAVGQVIDLDALD